MSKLVWKKPGAQRYEDGVDRGVLYLDDGTGVAWNGLTAVEEDLSDIETTSYYFDGTKYLETRSPGDFSAILRAFTYPDEFLRFDGYTELNNGVLLGEQPVYERFGLSYRTRVGNDIDGYDHGYKIHVLYNLIAKPENRAYKSLQGGQQTLNDMAWRISGVPEHVQGHRPTVHIIIDTTRLNPYLVQDVEKLLYGEDPYIPPSEEAVDGGTPSSTNAGTLDSGGYIDPDTTVIDGGLPGLAGSGVASPGAPAKLPPLSDLVSLLNTWVMIDIVDNGDGTWTANGPNDFIRMLDSTTFQISGASAIFTDEDTYEISTTSTL